jgi:hypothetical protein
MVKGQNRSSPFPLETGNTESGGLPPVSHPEDAAQSLQILRILQRQRNRQEGRTVSRSACITIDWKWCVKQRGCRCHARCFLLIQHRPALLHNGLIAK